MVNFYSEPEAEVKPKAAAHPEPRRLERQDHSFLDDDKRAGPQFNPLRLIFSCRTIAILIILLIIFTVWVAITRPPFVMNPIKSWLNADLVALESEPLTLAEVNEQLQSQVENFVVGENKLTLTTPQLRALVEDAFGEENLRRINLVLLPDVIKLYWDGADNLEHPLWLVAELEIDEEKKTKLTKFGTERIAAPGFLNGIGEQLLLSLFNFAGSDTEEGFVSLLIPLPDNIELRGVEVGEGRLEIMLNVSTGLSF